MIGLQFIFEFIDKKSDIADMLNIPRPNMTAWFKKERPIPYTQLEKLSQHFSLPDVLLQKEVNEEDKKKIVKQLIVNLAQKYDIEITLN